MEVQTIEPEVEPEVEAAPDPVETTPQEDYEALLKAMPKDEPRYVVGLRAKGLQIAGYTLSPGDVVPGAIHWPRLTSWLDQHYVEKA